MKIRKIISRLLLICGSVLILLSFQAGVFWDESQAQFHNLREGGLVYGLLLVSLGFVLILMKEVTVFQFLWIAWFGLFAIQMLRMHPAGIFISRIMLSVKLFWITILLGFVLAVFSIRKKCKGIF